MEENIVGKGENVGCKHFFSLRAIFPFLTVFSTSLKNILSFLSNLKLSSANPFNLEESKICCLEKG